MKKIGILAFLIVLLLGCDITGSDSGERDINTDIFTLEYHGYNDYYHGDCVALNYYFTNKSDYPTTGVYLTIALTYTDGYSTYTESIVAIEFVFADPHTMLTDCWFTFVCGNYWYTDHTIKKIQIFYIGASPYVWGE